MLNWILQARQAPRGKPVRANPLRTLYDTTDHEYLAEMEDPTSFFGLRRRIIQYPVQLTRNSMWFRFNLNGRVPPLFFQRLYVNAVKIAWRVNPRLLFDDSYYLSTYRDVANSRMDPLFHFLRYGAA